MPPVFGPVSPSPTRLWSCAETSGNAVSPSMSAKKLASSPSRNSSTTSEAPASPNTFFTMMASMAASASDRVVATVTPLPAAGPSALTTMGTPASRTKLLADRGSTKRPYSPVGIPCLAHRSLTKPLEPSSMAAAALGPKALMFSCLRRSTRPATSGPSGPTTTKSIACRLAQAVSASTSSAPMGTHSASRAIPALPGAQYSLSHSGEAAIFQHRACSRPPPPTTSIFMVRDLSPRRPSGLGLARLVA